MPAEKPRDERYLASAQPGVSQNSILAMSAT